MGNDCMEGIGCETGGNPVVWGEAKRGGERGFVLLAWWCLLFGEQYW
jgi:hypothetical protein